MEKRVQFNFKRRISIWVLSALIAAGIAAVSIYALDSIDRSQYDQRVMTSNVLMEKICHHITTAVQFNWENAHYVADQLENEDFQTIGQMLRFVEHCEQTIKDGAESSILLISDTGDCYVPGNEIFKWMSPSLLNSDTDELYVSDYQFGSRVEMQMHYLTRFSKPLVIEGVKFTHLSLACNMSELDSFFDISNYGEDSITFIIHSDGSQVYRQKKQTSLSGIFNVLSALKKAEFGYGMTYEQMRQDIQDGVNGTVFLTLDGENHFTSYYKLPLKDWVVVLMVPEASASAFTETFTQQIVISVLLLAGTVFAALMFILITSYRQISQKQRQVNERLTKAAEAERAANDAKTNFLSSMSHDIRTPMNAIVGMVTLASDRTDDPAYMKESLAKIKLASGHLLTLINDILDISKVESGKMKLNPESFSIQDCFRNLINILHEQAEEKQIALTGNTHGIDHEYLYGDKLRINQVFINLLSNAIKYTENGGQVAVDLYQEPCTDAPDSVCIRYVVRDNGIGMSEEFQQTMYQSFSRATDSRTSKIQGSGLGLAICKQMVDLMDGTIDCESKLGEGTCFTVKLKLPIAEGELKEPSLKEEAAGEGAFDSLAGMRVLVAEDNEMNWEIACATLEMYGVLADHAENGLSCVEMLRAAQPGYYGLVLMDVRMPVMDGREATRVIRQSETGWVRNIPVVAMTADAFTEDIQECLEAGMNDHISKPFDIQRLLRVLLKYRESSN